jgi:uncharacterized membrane protein
MRKFLPILALMTYSLFTWIPVHAQQAAPPETPAASAPTIPSSADFPPDQYYRAKVLATETTTKLLGETEFPWQVTTVRILNGDEKGKEIVIEGGGQFAAGGVAAITVGETMVVSKNVALGEVTYTIIDHYRLVPIAVLVAIFFIVVAVLGRRQGIASLLALVVSVVVIAGYIVPHIVHGSSPLGVTLIGAVIIMLSSLYLGHGFNKRTTIALGGTLLTLGIAVVAAILAVRYASLFGIGTEDTLSLQLGPLEGINFQGLLLGGIILGALGVLDDITTAQSATVDELRKANPQLGFSELYKRGLSVGREHIASLVNTLFLAYAGASLPLFLIFSVNRAYPVWTLLNSELIADEIVRTLVGSFALVLAVPITTFFAAYVFARSPASKEPTRHLHSH